MSQMLLSWRLAQFNLVVERKRERELTTELGLLAGLVCQ